MEAAQRLFSKPVSESEAASFGLTVEEASGPPCEVWPDVWPAVVAFESMATQWRMGPAGPIGLDYGPLVDVLRFRGVPRASWTQVFDDIRVLEDAALEQMRKEARQ